MMVKFWVCSLRSPVFSNGKKKVRRVHLIMRVSKYFRFCANTLETVYAPNAVCRTRRWKGQRPMVQNTVNIHGASRLHPRSKVSQGLSMEAWERQRPMWIFVVHPNRATREGICDALNGLLHGLRQTITLDAEIELVINPQQTADKFQNVRSHQSFDRCSGTHHTKE